MRCTDVIEWLRQDLDGRSDPSAEIAAHLEQCARCAEESGRLKAVSEAARAVLPRSDVPYDFTERVVDALVSPSRDRELAEAARPRLRSVALLGAFVAAAVLIALLVPPRDHNGATGRLQVQSSDGLWIDAERVEGGEFFGLQAGNDAEVSGVRARAIQATLLCASEPAQVTAGWVLLETTEPRRIRTPLGEVRLQKNSRCALLFTQREDEMGFNTLMKSAPAAMVVAMLAGSAEVANAQGQKQAVPNNPVAVGRDAPPDYVREILERLERLEKRLDAQWPKQPQPGQPIEFDLDNDGDLDLVAQAAAGKSIYVVKEDLDNDGDLDIYVVKEDAWPQHARRKFGPAGAPIPDLNALIERVQRGDAQARKELRKILQRIERAVGGRIGRLEAGEYRLTLDDGSFPLKGGKLTGRIVGADGNPLQDVRIEVAPPAAHAETFPPVPAPHPASGASPFQLSDPRPSMGWRLEDYVIDFGGTVHTFDAKTGKLLSKRGGAGLSGLPQGDPRLPTGWRLEAKDGTVYVADSEGNIYAVDATTGKSLWKAKPDAVPLEYYETLLDSLVLRTEKTTTDLQKQLENVLAKGDVLGGERLMDALENQKQLTERRQKILALLEKTRVARESDKQEARKLETMLRKEVELILIDVNRKSRDLHDQIVSFQVERDRLKLERVRLQQLKAENARLRQRLTDIEAVRKPSGTLGILIRPGPVEGSVLGTSSNGQVTVTLGSNDGVQAGDMLDVMRGKELIGRVRIIKTDKETALAQLKFVRNSYTLSAGDSVRSPPARAFVQGLPAVRAPNNIQGHVLRAKGQLILISVGSNDGVRIGDLMHIVRGKDYVGSMHITKVEKDAAVGRILKLQAGREITADDKVWKADPPPGRLGPGDANRAQDATVRWDTALEGIQRAGEAISRTFENSADLRAGNAHSRGLFDLAEATVVKRSAEIRETMAAFEKARAALDAVKMEELVRDLKRMQTLVNQDLNRLRRDLADLKQVLEAEETVTEEEIPEPEKSGGR